MCHLFKNKQRLICISCIYTNADDVKYKAQRRTTEVSFNYSRRTELTEMPGEANLERQELRQVPPLSEQFKIRNQLELHF